jgi:ferredoxin-thioredoxin reductase catalytic chain
MDGTGAEPAPRPRFAAGTSAEDLKAYMAPFVERLGYRFNRDEEFVGLVLAGELQILATAGDVFCPCRVRTGDPREDAKIVCPCIPFHREQFAGMRKCWCGLFVRSDVEDDAALMGVIDDPSGPVDVPVARVSDLRDGDVRHVSIGKREIAVVRLGQEFFALSNVCRHAFGPLAEGWMDGYLLVCPWHGWRYDVRDGTTDHPDADVRTYETVVRDGEVLVRV